MVDIQTSTTLVLLDQQCSAKKKIPIVIDNLIQGVCQEISDNYSSAESLLRRLPVDDIPDGLEVFRLPVLVLQTTRSQFRNR